MPALASERPIARTCASLTVGHLFVNSAVAMNHENAVGEHEVARLQSARKRADDAGPDYQFRAGHQIESAARGFGCALVTDSVADDRELFAADFRAEAMQAVERERSAIAAGGA